MATERESLSGLETQQKRLSRIVSQRREIYSAAGVAGRIKFGSDWETDLRIARVRERVKISLIRAEDSLAEVNLVVERFRETQIEQLITQAHSYLDEVSLRKVQLRDVKRYAQAGHLPQDLLERREAEFRQLAARPGTDPDLKRGIELLEERRRQEQGQTSVEPQAPVVEMPAPVPVETPEVAAKKEEGEKLAQVELYLEERIAVFDGREVRFGVFKSKPNFSWELLVYMVSVYLAVKPNERALVEFTSKELDEFLRTKDCESGFPAGSVIRSLRNKIEIDPQNPEFIIRSGSMSDSRYRFNPSEFIVFPRKTQVAQSDGVHIEELPVEDKKAEALANIAEIQKRVDSGVFTDTEAIARAQEYARALGGTIEFNPKIPEISKPDLGRVEVPKRKREIEEELFELPNGKLFIIKAGRSIIDIFRFILNGHLEKTPALLAGLAEAIYGSEINNPESELDLDGAKRRISANITHLNRLLTQDEAGYFIKNLTTKSDSNKGIPSKFDLVEIPQVQTDEPKASEEELEQKLEPQVEEPEAKTVLIPKRPIQTEKPTQRVMNSRGVISYARSKGFEVINGGGDLQIIDSRGKKITSLPGHHGGKDLNRRTYHRIIKAIDERFRSIQEQG